MMNGTLPQVREELGITLRELGEIAGCSESAICKKLNGISTWKLEEAFKVAAHLHKLNGSSVGELFGLGECN